MNLKELSAQSQLIVAGVATKQLAADIDVAFEQLYGQVGEWKPFAAYVFADRVRFRKLMESFHDEDVLHKIDGWQSADDVINIIPDYYVIGGVPCFDKAVPNSVMPRSGEYTIASNGKIKPASWFLKDYRETYGEPWKPKVIDRVPVTIKTMKDFKDYLKKVLLPKRDELKRMPSKVDMLLQLYRDASPKKQPIDIVFDDNGDIFEV